MSINEVKVGSLIRVKVGRNLIYAKVVEILDGAVRVCSLANNKEFNVPESRVQLDGEQPAPANAEPQTEATVQTEQESAEASAQEPQAEQAEAAVETSEQEAAEPEAPAADAESGTPATVEVVPEDEAAEFTPSGEDEEGDSRSHPRTSALDADRLQDAGTDPLRKHLPRDQREGAAPHQEERRQGQVRNRGVIKNKLKPEEISKIVSLPA